GDRSHSIRRFANHVEPVVQEKVTKHLAEALVIVDDQDARRVPDQRRSLVGAGVRQWDHFRGSGHHVWLPCHGRTTRTRVPLPGAEVTSHVPPIISTRSLMASI